MTHPFDLPLPGGKTVGASILSRLLDKGIMPVVADIGARNGLFILPAGYAAAARLIGFEPNQEEYDLLTTGRTAAMLSGERQPAFKEKTYFNWAVWDSEEEREFFIKVGPGACTLMGPTDTRTTDRIFLDTASGSERKSLEELHTRTLKTEPMRCNALDAVLGDETLDFVKIDVEGAELRVLKGVDKLLQKRQVLCIKTEFAMFPIYNEHPVLGDLHVFLNSRGYRLLHLDFDHPSYSRNPTTIPPYLDRRAQYAGDAYFVLDPDRNDLPPLSRQRLAATSLALGFRSFAVSLLRDAKLLSNPEIDEIESVLSRDSVRNRLIRGWKNFPHALQGWLGKVGLRI